jgi:hypothetical protein
LQENQFLDQKHKLFIKKIASLQPWCVSLGVTQFIRGFAMKTYASRYPTESTYNVILDEHKLKLKNARPEALADLIDKKHSSGSARIKSLIGFKHKPPIVIQALADLHLEAKYQIDGKAMIPLKPKDGWEAAKAYVGFKDLQVNPHPGKPIPSRSPSTALSSSVESELLGSTGKTVRWADNA